MDSDAFTISYRFSFADGSLLEFPFHLAPGTLNLVDKPTRPPPDWARMDTFRCSHCPLPTTTTHCPLAAGLQDLLDTFRDRLSHEKGRVEVVTKDRTYVKDTSLQAGVSAMLGISMVTTGCPVMARMKPMVRFHLPFASLEETRYRAMSMYALAQHLRARTGRTAETTMAGLTCLYEDASVINLNVFKTLSAQKVKDASLNAVSILDSFAAFTTGSLDAEMLDDLLEVFDAWMGT